MNKEALENLKVGLLDYVDEGNGFSRIPNQQEVMNKLNELIDKFNVLAEVVANANSTNK